MDPVPTAFLLRRWRRWCFIVLAGAGFGHVPAVHAHVRWADGTRVPEWVRNACCGPGDLHHLRPSQVHRRPEGLIVDGLHAVVPYAKVLPSMDGDYWVFFRDFDDGTQYVFCLFAPPQGS